MKRKTAIILVLLMLLSAIFSSCAAVGKTDERSSSSTSDSTSGTDITDTSKIQGFNETGYPITDEPSTFTIMAATSLLSFDDSIHMNNVAEATNVYPEWIIVPVSAAAERKALVYASGDLPDVMGPRMVNQSDTVQYGPSGTLMNVKGLLQKYATNLVRFLTPDLWAQIECYDGNIYFLPTIYSNLGGTANGFGGNFYSQPITWMKQLGLKEATTVDEFYNNLVAIRDGDPNGNGIKDEIPLAISNLGNVLGALEGFYCWFGRPGTYYIEDNGKVIDGRLYEEHKEGIKFLQKCYKEGLLDPELFTISLETFGAKASADPIVYGYIFGFTPNRYTGDQRALDYYDVMPLLKDQDGNISYIYKNRSSSAISYQAAITSACKNPEVVVRWANYLWTPEVTIQTNDGPFGIRFEYDENGKLIRFEDTTHPDKIPEGYDSFLAFRAGNQEQQIPRLYGPLVTEYLEKEIGFFHPISVYSKFNFKGEELWEPYAVQEFPVVTPTAEENEMIIQYSTDMNKLYNETITRWIVGDADIDAEWDTFVKNMNDFGAQEVLKIKQVQADRYFESLKNK